VLIPVARTAARVDRKGLAFSTDDSCIDLLAVQYDADTIDPFDEDGGTVDDRHAELSFAISMGSPQRDRTAYTS
jgi:hypothetical protein